MFCSRLKLSGKYIQHFYTWPIYNFKINYINSCNTSITAIRNTYAGIRFHYTMSFLRYTYLRRYASPCNKVLIFVIRDFLKVIYFDFLSLRIGTFFFMIQTWIEWTLHVKQLIYTQYGSNTKNTPYIERKGSCFR